MRFARSGQPIRESRECNKKGDMEGDKALNLGPSCYKVRLITLDRWVSNSPARFLPPEYRNHQKHTMSSTFSLPTLLRSGAIALALLLAPSLVAQDRLPDVTLTDINGQKVNLTSFGEKGEITVINFWATWCTPCKKELNNIADLYPDWQADYGVRIVAISIDDARNKAKVKTYVNGQSWEYDVLLDVNGILKQKLNFQTIPFTVIVDREGNIVSRHAGYVDGDEYLLEEELAELAGAE